jgi:hypothetical protein
MTQQAMNPMDSTELTSLVDLLAVKKMTQHLLCEGLLFLSMVLAT